jgi:tyrosine-specific transport protein
MGRQQLSVWSASLLLAGNMTGAGILALPINAGLSGFFPTLATLCATCILMTTTAWIIARCTLAINRPKLDLPSIFEHYLPPAGRWFCTLFNLLMLFGFLMAYLSCMSVTVGSLTGLSPTLSLLVVFSTATPLTIFGIRLIVRFNTVLMAILVGSFATMVYLCLPHVRWDYVVQSRWQFSLYSLPCIVFGFHFHNIIPTICDAFERDARKIFWSIVAGCTLGLAMAVVWAYVALGSLPFRGIGEGNVVFAYTHQLPANLVVSRHLNLSSFALAGQIFAFMAVMTSFMSNGVATKNFIADILSHTVGRTWNLGAWTATLGIPLFMIYAVPEMFLTAIDVAGGIAIVVLFGIVQGWLSYKYLARERFYCWIGIIVVAFFTLALICSVVCIVSPPHLDAITQ